MERACRLVVDYEATGIRTFIFVFLNQEVSAAEIITEAMVAGGLAMQGFLSHGRKCCCHSKSPGAEGAPTESPILEQHTCSEQGNAQFQERERQTLCLANWHDRVWDPPAPGVEGRCQVQEPQSPERMSWRQGLGNMCFHHVFVLVFHFAFQDITEIVLD